MKFSIAFILVFLTTFSFGQNTKAKSSPNILLILADDLGYADVGFNGNKKFETPHLDALAKKSLQFTNAYAAGANCAPSRACLLSGNYTPKHGVFAVGSSTRGNLSKMKVVPVANTGSLHTKFETIAEALKKQGYTTGLFGKWHLGNSAETLPTAQGFDEYVDPRKNNPVIKRDMPDDPKGIFSITDAAINFMTQERDKPFFCFLSHHAIHVELEARPSSLEKFLKNGLDSSMAHYAACLYDFDSSIGMVMAKLKASGLEENTLVVITSDNGATMQSSQEPLRGNKGCYYEGGIKEPFLVYFPKKIKEGINETPIINIDLYPTFITAAGGKANAGLDGENLLPLFFEKRKTTKRQSIFWHFPGYLNDPVIRGRDNDFRTRPVTVMRKGDWKIHLYHEEWVLNKGKGKYDGVELYNLKSDIGERNNIASLHPQKRDLLVAEVLAWIQKIDAKLPVPIDTNHTLNNNDGKEN
jgi:arylsulfatase A-like enzyme